MKNYWQQQGIETVGDRIKKLNSGEKELEDVYEEGDPTHKHVYVSGDKFKLELYIKCSCGRKGV